LTPLTGLEARSGREVERLRRQVEIMLAHVLDKGLTPAPQAWMFEAVRPENDVVDLSGADGWNPAGVHQPAGEADRLMSIETLVRAHRDLSRVVAPAKPATLELLHGYREGRRPARPTRIPRQKTPGTTPARPGTRVPLPRFALAGSTVPLVRLLMGATGVFLAGFVLLAALPDVRSATAGSGIAAGGGQLAFGDLLLRELFLLCAAALGAGLTALYRAGREVARGVYDPELDHTYLQRILLGMATGLIVAELLPFGTGADTLVRPAVALVGGFCAGVVHSVLSRLVAALEVLFGSGESDNSDDMRRELQKRADEVQAQADRATLNKLLEIRRIASSGAPTRAIIEEIDRVITVVAPS
jgi:hypothetical protein